jgi:hypothetical protein
LNDLADEEIYQLPQQEEDEDSENDQQNQTQ